MPETSTIIMWALIVGVGHFSAGQLTGFIWQIYSPHDIDKEDVRAMRILWFAFLPLGLAALLFFNLDRWLNKPPGGDYQL